MLKIPWVGGTRAHGGGGCRRLGGVVGGGVYVRLGATLGRSGARTGG